MVYLLFYILQKTPNGPWFCSICIAAGDQKIGGLKVPSDIIVEVST